MVGEVPLELERPLGQRLALHHVEVRERGRRRRRVTRIGVAVPPQAGAGLPEGFGHPGGRDHRAHREVAARDALRARDDVGLEVPPRAREPVADASEPRDDLVRDEQDAGLAADRADLGEVALGRREHAPGADHRLAEERGHPLGTGGRDRLAERGGGVPGDLHDVADQRAVAGRVRLDAGQARPGDVHPVVRVLAGDEERALGLAAAAASSAGPSSSRCRSSPIRRWSGRPSSPGPARAGRRARRARSRGGSTGRRRSSTPTGAPSDDGPPRRSPRGRSRRCSTRAPRSHRGSAVPARPRRARPRPGR